MKHPTLLSELPQSPVDCTLHNETSALEVNCVPGSNGGLPQHFLLEVRGSLKNPGLEQIPQSDQGVAGEAPSIYEERNREPIFQLRDLKPGFDYTIAVYAVNDQGKSHPVLLENIRVVQPMERKVEKGSAFLEDLTRIIPQASSENAIIIVGLIGKSKNPAQGSLTISSQRYKSLRSLTLVEKMNLFWS